MTATAIKLWEATDAIEIVREWIDEHDEELRANEGVFPPELAELLDQVSADFTTKAERVGLFIRELNATGKAIKEEEERLRARRKSIENTADGLKRYLEMNMLIAEKMRIDRPLITLRIQKNPPSCKVEREIPEDELATWFALDERLVVYTPPQPAHYSLNPSGVITASKKFDEKGKVTGYESPIEGVVVSQGASLRIA
jgi:hypothetical protein